ncbi:MAG: DoxX family protein [Acidimicrobiia bacterium]|nr:DoxX family protein [Acidimicrobiia bacterium]
MAGTASEKARAVSAKVSDVASSARGTVHDVAAGQPLPFQTETYVKVNAAVQVGAGVLLAVGKFPRLSSAALAATIVPTTFAGHRFWEAEGAERQAQQMHFMKNVSVLGGLILAAVDLEGRPGLGYRAKHARKEAKIAAKAATANAALGSRAIKANAKAAGRLAAANASDAGSTSRRRAKSAGKSARKEAEVYGKRAAKEAKPFRKTASKRVDAYSHAASARAAELQKAAQARASDVGSRVQEALPTR